MPSNVANKWLTISGMALLATSIIGLILWLIWSKRKLEVLKVQAALVDEKAQTRVEIIRTAENLATQKRELQIQAETQQKSASIRRQITDLKKEHKIKLDKIKAALTWEELGSI